MAKVVSLPFGPAGQSFNMVTSQGEQRAITVDSSAFGGGASNFAIFRPGVATAAPAYATLAEIRPLIAAADGAFTLYVDSSVAAAHVDALGLDGKGLLTLSPARGPIGGAAMTLTIDDGAQLRNPLSFNGQLDVVSTTTTVPALVVSGNAQGIQITNGARLRLLAGATRPFLEVAASPPSVAFEIDFSSGFFTSAPGIPFVHIQAGGIFSNVYTRLSPFTQPQNAAVSGPEGSTYIFEYDASVTIPDNSGTFLGTQLAFEIDTGLVTENVLDFTLERLTSIGGISISSLFPSYAAPFGAPPASARLLSYEIEVIEQLASPAMTAATAQIVDADTGHQFTGISDMFTGIGFNAPLPATLQCNASATDHPPNLILSITGDTFNNLTAGHVRARIVFTANPRQVP